MVLAQKRGRLIGKLNSLSHEFHYVEPNVFVKILNIYATSFYGSSLWDIFSKQCDIRAPDLIKLQSLTKRVAVGYCILKKNLGYIYELLFWILHGLIQTVVGLYQLPLHSQQFFC